MTAAWPWDRTLTWAEARSGGRDVLLAPGDADRANIARRLELEGLPALEARLRVEPWLDGAELRGRITAEVVQICGVTLDPFSSRIDEPVLARFVPEGSPNAPAPIDGDVAIDLDAEDPPEVAAGGVIDPAALVFEVLALAIDPFPRKPGAEFGAVSVGAPPSPFGALAKLVPPQSDS